MPDLVYDIETSPRPAAELEPLYVPPKRTVPPWDEKLVRYGLMKDEEKRKEKRDKIFAEHQDKAVAEEKDIAEHKDEWLSEAALSPVTGIVLAIGVRAGEKRVIIGEGGESEKDILKAFWSLYRKYATGGRFVGYCSNFFDFPFIVWRSYWHAIAVPSNAWDKTGRYPAYGFVDLIDRLPKRGFNNESRKLTDICGWLGLGSKPEGIDGGNFAGLWLSNADARQVAVDYLVNDLDMTWALAERMGVIQ